MRAGRISTWPTLNPLSYRLETPFDWNSFGVSPFQAVESLCPRFPGLEGLNLPASQDKRFRTLHEARKSQHQGFENQPSLGLTRDARDDLKQLQDIGGHVDLKPSPCGGVNLSRLTARSRSRGNRLNVRGLGARHDPILSQDAQDIHMDAMSLPRDCFPRVTRGGGKCISPRAGGDNV